MNWNPKTWLGSSAAALGAPQEWRWRKKMQGRTQEITSRWAQTKEPWWGYAVQGNRQAPDLSPSSFLVLRHQPWAIHGHSSKHHPLPNLGPQGSWAARFHYQCQCLDGEKTSSCVCVCTHCILYTGPYSVDSVNSFQIYWNSLNFHIFGYHKPLKYPENSNMIIYVALLQSCSKKRIWEPACRVVYTSEDLKITDKGIGEKGELDDAQKCIIQVLCTCWRQIPNVSRNFQAARTNRVTRWHGFLPLTPAGVFPQKSSERLSVTSS